MYISVFTVSIPIRLLEFKALCSLAIIQIFQNYVLLLRITLKQAACNFLINEFHIIWVLVILTFRLFPVTAIFTKVILIIDTNTAFRSDLKFTKVARNLEKAVKNYCRSITCNLQLLRVSPSAMTTFLWITILQSSSWTLFSFRRWYFIKS